MEEVTRYFDSVHPIEILKVYKPEKPAETTNKNIVLFWVDWKYGCLIFPKWTIWGLPNGSIGIIKYSSTRLKNVRFALIKAQREFWHSFSAKLADCNPIGLSKLEFMKKVKLPGIAFDTKVVSGEEEIELTVEQTKREKNNKNRVI